MHKNLPFAFLVLLFFSGLASLVYEVIWTRVLLSTFGATVYATGTVLTSFMAGLALGSFIASRLADRLRMHPVRIYAWLELIIGLYALVFPFLLQGITAIHITAFREIGGSFYLFSLIRFVLAFLILLLPAVLMGATLPVITRQGVRHLGELGNRLGQLYAVNTTGAACGTFLAGYIFIEHLGIQTTTYLTAALNVAIFVGAMLVARVTARVDVRAGESLAVGDAQAAKGEAPAPVKVKAKATTQTKTKGKGKGKTKPRGAGIGGTIVEATPDRWLLLLVIALSGFCALSYEVLWGRILVYVLGNFVHSFSLMLTAFLVGIALGSYLLGRYSDRFRRPVLTLAVFQLAIGLAAVIILPIFTQLIGFRDNFLASLAFEGTLADYKDPWWTFTMWKLVVTFLMMFVPTLMMGASFPLVSRLYVRSREKLARGVGVIYSANTCGAILGAFTASFLLIPWIGLRNAGLLTALLNLVGAALLYARWDRRWRPKRLGVSAGVVAGVLLLAVWIVPSNVFYPVFASVEKGKDLIYVDEAVSGTVTIHATPSGFRVIDINGLNVAGTKFGFLCTQKLQAHFPLLMHPDPRQVMQIGFGTGGTCFSISTHPEVQNIDCVEINPGIIKAAPFFEENNHNILADPMVSVTIEDARNYVLTTDQKYDVILSDSIHPRFTGNGLLYTSDYFAICADVLKDDGVFSTWLPTSYLGDEEFRIIVRSMQSVFPHILVWYMNNTIEGYTIAMGSRQPFLVDWDQLEERIVVPSVAEDLRAVHVENAYDLFDMVILSGADVAPYLDRGLLNTEDRPIIEFRAPRNMNRDITEYLNLERLIHFRRMPDAIVSSWGAVPETAAARRETLQRYYDGTTTILEAHQRHLTRRYGQEEALLNQALQINPDDRDAPFLLHRLSEMKQGRRVEW